MTRREFFLLFIVLLMLSGCGKEQTKEQLPDQTVAVENPSSDINTEVAEDEEIIDSVPIIIPPVTQENDGSIRFHLSAAASISIKSISDSEGVVITDCAKVNNITGMLSQFIPYSPKDDYVPEYDYTLIFYDASGMELTTIQAYDSFIISYNGEIFYNNTDQFYIWKIRNEYIESSRTTFSCDTTSFCVNGKEYDLRDLDPSINAITKYSWLGYGEFPEPTLVLECHINPNVGYCAIFDVEKMDFIYGVYGAPFTYKKYSATSLVYVFENNVYNYWGDILYHNNDDDFYINYLEYDLSTDNNSALLVTLANRQKEERITVSCVNYHIAKDLYPEFDTYNSTNSLHLAEFSADLTHDGNDEVLNVYQVERSGEMVFLEITDAEGNIKRLEYAHTSHAGWNSVYLCNMNNEEYLLVFNPYECTGIADYEFVLYYLTEEDTIQIVDSGYYSFCYGADEGAATAFNEERFRSFANKVETYLQNSYLLMSTEDCVTTYSSPGNLISLADKYETEKWILAIKNNSY